MDNHILVVEDDAAIREGVRILLEGEGYIVQEAEDGYQCLKKVSDDIDLVILDIMMPKMNGDEAAKCIRKINPSIPIVAMSAQSEYSMNQMIMNDSISKPIDEQKLNHILSKYVS